MITGDAEVRHNDDGGWYSTGQVINVTWDKSLPRIMAVPQLWAPQSLRDVGPVPGKWSGTGIWIPLPGPEGP